VQAKTKARQLKTLAGQVTVANVSLHVVRALFAKGSLRFGKLFEIARGTEPSFDQNQNRTTPFNV